MYHVPKHSPMTACLTSSSSKVVLRTGHGIFLTRTPKTSTINSIIAACMSRRTTSNFRRSVLHNSRQRNATHGKSTTKHNHLSPTIDDTAGKVRRCLTLHDIPQQHLGSRRVLPPRHPEHIAEGELSSFATYAFLQQGRLLCHVRSSG